MAVSKSAAALIAIFSLMFFASQIAWGKLVASSLPAAVTKSQFGHLGLKVNEDEEGKRDSIVFVGDIMLARDVEKKLALFGTTYPFAAIKDKLYAKTTVGNFEAAIPAVHKPTESFKMVFSVATQNLDALVDGGITHLSLANNHSLDHGVAAYANTITSLTDRHFVPFGHATQVSTSSVKYVEVDGQKVALIAIGAVFGYPLESAWKPVVEAAASSSDLQVVYIHWGDEYEIVHNDKQEAFAHSLIDSGVDLIVGHHPHVVQDIERYHGKLIFYSLGNFIFDQYFSQAVQEGLILELSKEKSGWQVAIEPVESKTVRIQPRVMNDMDKSVFLSQLASRSDSGLLKEILDGSLSLQFQAP